MRKALKFTLRILLVLLLLWILNVAVAGWILWKTPLRLAGGMAASRWPFEAEKAVVEVSWGPVDGNGQTNRGKKIDNYRQNTKGIE